MSGRDDAERAMAQMAAMQNQGLSSLGARPAAPPSPMQEHLTSLEHAVSNLERMQLQLDNMLDTIRGAAPRAEGEAKTNQPSCLIDHLRMHDDRINYLCNSISAQIEELQGVL